MNATGELTSNIRQTSQISLENARQTRRDHGRFRSLIYLYQRCSPRKETSTYRATTRSERLAPILLVERARKLRLSGRSSDAHQRSTFENDRMIKAHVIVVVGLDSCHRERVCERHSIQGRALPERRGLHRVGWSVDLYRRQCMGLHLYKYAAIPRQCARTLDLRPRFERLQGTQALGSRSAEGAEGRASSAADADDWSSYAAQWVR